MKLEQVQKLQLKNMVEQVLHVPGNYRGGILEMAMVFDCSLEKEMLESLAGETAGALKRQGEIFRNVRLNTILWKSDEELFMEVTPLPYLMMGTYFQKYEHCPKRKTLEKMTNRLKLFQARSKLIFIFTDGNYVIGNHKALEQSLQPFLGRKLIYAVCRDGRVEYSRQHKIMEESKGEEA